MHRELEDIHPVVEFPGNGLHTHFYVTSTDIFENVETIFPFQKSRFLQKKMDVIESFYIQFITIVL